MKFLALALLALSQPAFAADLMVCENIKFFTQDDNGNGRLEPSDFSIRVRESAEGLRGLIAELKQGSESRIEKDVEITEPKKAQVESIGEFVQLALPQIRWSDVASVRAGEVAVKQNRDDAGGMAIFELYGKDKSLLGKVAQIGWGFGVCGE